VDRELVMPASTRSHHCVQQVDALDSLTLKRYRVFQTVFTWDKERARFLDGPNIQTKVGSELHTSFSGLEIINYTDPDGNVIFYGEEDVSGNPARVDSSLAFRFREHFEYFSSLPIDEQRNIINSGQLLDRDPMGI